MDIRAVIIYVGTLSVAVYLITGDIVSAVYTLLAGLLLWLLASRR